MAIENGENRGNMTNVLILPGSCSNITASCHAIHKFAEFQDGKIEIFPISKQFHYCGLMILNNTLKECVTMGGNSDTIIEHLGR